MLVIVELSSEISGKKKVLNKHFFDYIPKKQNKNCKIIIKCSKIYLVSTADNFSSII